MSQALSSQRSWIARIAVLAMVASLMAFGAAPAGAAIDTSGSCPDSIADAGFTDLAGVPAAAVDAINCVADYGISTGTTATTFDPFAAVQRWQMALFLTRQAAVHGVTLPDGSDQGFTDLGGVPAAAVTAINQTAQLGISTGTSATTFDPFADVERWQMALFLTRLITGAGLTLPAGADQGFTDLDGVPAAAVTAINQLGELDISDGTTATTFDPFASVERWAMALFLTRVLAADGITPPVAGTKGIVTAFADPNLTYDNAATGVSAVLVVDNETADTFSVDGASASRAFFVSQVTAGDEIVFNKVDTDADFDTFALTNKPTAESGLVGAVDVTGTSSFSIVTIGNTPLNTFTENVEYSAAGTAYTVDGAAATLSSFLAAVSHGDTVVLTDTSSPKDGVYEAIALTNGSASGAVKTISKAASVDGDATNDATFTINGELGDYARDDATYDSDALFAALSADAANQVYTIDGTSSTQAQFVTAITDGDSVTYSRAGGKETFALTNGTIDLSFTGLTIEGAAGSAVVGNTLHVLVDGAASTFDMTIATSIRVDGVTVSLAEVKALIDAGLPVGDSASYAGATKVLTLANATSTPELSIADVVASDDANLANDTFDLLAGTVVIFNNLPANFGTPNTKYFVNDTEVTQGAYVDYLVEIAADTNTTGDSFQAVISGGFVQHRLKTTEVLP